MSADRRLIEAEFRDFMRQVYPGVSEGSPQFKTSRVTYYAGAYNLITHQKGKADERRKNFDQMVGGIKDAMEFAADAAKKGIPVEMSLEDLVEADAGNR